jgi:hypothetical protein
LLVVVLVLCVALDGGELVARLPELAQKAAAIWIREWGF